MKKMLFLVLIILLALLLFGCTELFDKLGGPDDNDLSAEAFDTSCTEDSDCVVTPELDEKICCFAPCSYEAINVQAALIRADWFGEHCDFEKDYGCASYAYTCPLPPENAKCINNQCVVETV